MLAPSGALLALTLLHAPPEARDAEWPQWRGPDRTGISTEKGLLQAWPAAGPALVWEARGIGDGFSTVSISRGRIFTQGTRGSKAEVIALDYATGKEIWSTPNGEPYENSYGDGPRGTPTVDGDVLYALGGQGDLVALEVKSGKQLWALNILKKFRAENTTWGISESPLVVRELLICTPGGKDATLVALDKKTGETVWTSTGLSDPAGYSSAILIEAAGVEQVVNVTHKGIAGVALDDGRFLWRYDRAANSTANIATPLFHGGEVFVTSDYGTGCALLRLQSAGEGKVAAEEVYFNKKMKNHHGGVLRVGDHIYGYSSETLTCMEWKTGAVAWSTKETVGKGSLVYADGCLYVVGQGGRVGLVKATPEKYLELGRFEVEHGNQPAWAHPVVAGGRLFVRTQGKVRAYDVSAPPLPVQ